MCLDKEEGVRKINIEILFERKNEQFAVNKVFDIKFLSPVGRYVQWKLENNHCDDYNELYHATKLTEDLKTYTDVWYDTHCLLREGLNIGVLIIVGGDLKKLETKYDIKDDSLLLKYFHITEKGNGYGSFWLRSVVIPHYRERGFKHIYVNSSHKDSFPFYRRLGSLIATYELMSDNNLYSREGGCFLINIEG
jgi:hypothetical protein